MSKHDVLILVAEDQPSLRHLVQKQLFVLGYTTVEMVDNGTMAVQKATERHYHLIFMDIMMPDLDGLLATEQIRKYEAEAGQRTPIVAMTGLADKDQCLNAGMDDFLQKPVMLDTLQQALDRWL